MGFASDGVGGTISTLNLIRLKLKESALRGTFSNTLADPLALAPLEVAIDEKVDVSAGPKTGLESEDLLDGGRQS